MRPPGAPMSGLKLRSGASPYDEKVEMRFAVGLGSLANVSVHVIVTAPAARRPLITTPRAEVIAATGIVMSGGPVSVGERKPATVLFMGTQTEPVRCAMG